MSQLPGERGAQSAHNRQYEAIQADVFDHVLAILREFGLQAFQDITDIEVNSAQNLAIPEWQANYKEASKYLVEQNRKLANRPNACVNAAVRRVEEKLKQLGISDDITVAVSERTLSLVWRATSGD